MQLKYDGDEVYIAYCFPYTYTEQMKLMSKLNNAVKYKDRVKRVTMSKTKAGNDLDMLIVTNFHSS